ncbi:MAG: aromatic ring-hydroxylating dioxygenase subunit alpha [Rhodanobacteraceae bacterium]
MTPDTDDLVPQPLARARALPARFYTDTDSQALDRRAVFAHGWQWVAHASALAGAGDHVVTEIAGVPLLIVRGDDDVVRALHNVCRHRAGPLATCGGRGAKRLRCQYHGWSYALDGQLLSATEMDATEDFNVSDVCLPQAQVAQWQGFIFASLDAQAPPLTEVLEGIAARLGDRGLESYRLHERVSYDIACNWKVYIDNYLEGYHVPHIHPELNALLDYRCYIVETAPWHSLQYSPLESGDELYGKGEALYYMVWPNTLLNILPNRLQVNRVLPVDAQRCRVEFDYYYPPHIDAAELAQRHQRDHEFSDLVQRQDVDMCEMVQRNLASGSYHAGRLNPRREDAVHHFHELLRAAYRTETAAQG